MTRNFLKGAVSNCASFSSAPIAAFFYLYIPHQLVPTWLGEQLDSTTKSISV